MPLKMQCVFLCLHVDREFSFKKKKVLKMLVYIWTWLQSVAKAYLSFIFLYIILLCIPYITRIFNMSIILQQEESFGVF